MIDSPRRFDYTQRVVTYLEVGIPEPGTAALAIAALVAAAAIQARVQRRRRS